MITLHICNLYLHHQNTSQYKAGENWFQILTSFTKPYKFLGIHQWFSKTRKQPRSKITVSILTQFEGELYLYIWISTNIPSTESYILILQLIWLQVFWKYISSLPTWKNYSKMCIFSIAPSSFYRLHSVNFISLNTSAKDYSNYDFKQCHTFPSWPIYVMLTSHT